MILDRNNGLASRVATATKARPGQAETGRSCFGSLKAQTMREDCRPAAKPRTAVNVPRLQTVGGSIRTFRDRHSRPVAAIPLSAG